MAKPQKYNLIYAPEVKEHLKSINKQHHIQIREAIEERLSFEPDRETRNRKPLKESGVWEDAWELRCGANSPKIRRILQKSMKSIRAGRGIPHDDFWAETSE